MLAKDPDAEKNFFEPQREALREYVAALDEFHLDGLVYPSAQMPSPDETMPQNGGLSTGPESHTGWGEPHWRSCGGGAGWVLSGWAAVWVGDQRAALEGWGLVGVGLCV